MDLDFGQAMNTTGWEMQVRLTDTSEGTNNIILGGDFSFAVADNDNGVTNAKVTVSVTAAVMATIASGNYVYDLQNNLNDVVKTYLFGIFKVNEDITV
jgi:hypothetical protein